MRSYLVTLSFIVGSVLASEPVTNYCEANDGIVETPQGNTRYCFKHYELTYSKNNHIPIQASYKLEPGVRYDPNPFSNPIKSDKYLIAEFDREMASHTAGFDFAPLANNHITQTNKRERNLEVNRLPMYASVNRKGGMWDWLGRFELQQPLKVGSVYSVNGAVTAENDFKPKAFYKVLYQADIKMAIAFLVPNTEDLEFGENKYITSIGCIEQELGYPLLSKNSYLPESLRWAVAYSSNVWADGSKISTSCNILGENIK